MATILGGVKSPDGRVCRWRKPNARVEGHALRIGRLYVDLAGEALVAILRRDARRLVIEGAADAPALRAHR